MKGFCPKKCYSAFNLKWILGVYCSTFNGANGSGSKQCFVLLCIEHKQHDQHQLVTDWSSLLDGGQSGIAALCAQFSALVDHNETNQEPQNSSPV